MLLAVCPPSPTTFQCCRGLAHAFLFALARLHGKHAPQHRNGGKRETRQLGFPLFSPIYGIIRGNDATSWRECSEVEETTSHGKEWKGIWKSSANAADMCTVTFAM